MSRRPHHAESILQHLRDLILSEVVVMEVTANVVVVASTAAKACWQVEEVLLLSSEPFSASFLLSF